VKTTGGAGNDEEEEKEKDISDTEANDKMQPTEILVWPESRRGGKR